LDCYRVSTHTLPSHYTPRSDCHLVRSFPPHAGYLVTGLRGSVTTTRFLVSCTFLRLLHERLPSLRHAMRGSYLYAAAYHGPDWLPLRALRLVLLPCGCSRLPGYIRGFTYLPTRYLTWFTTVHHHADFRIQHYGFVATVQHHTCRTLPGLDYYRTFACLPRRVGCRDTLTHVPPFPDAAARLPSAYDRCRPLPERSWFCAVTARSVLPHLTRSSFNWLTRRARFVLPPACPSGWRLPHLPGSVTAYRCYAWLVTGSWFCVTVRVTGLTRVSGYTTCTHLHHAVYTRAVRTTYARLRYHTRRSVHPHCWLLVYCCGSACHYYRFPAVDVRLLLPRTCWITGSATLRLLTTRPTVTFTAARYRWTTPHTLQGCVVVKLCRAVRLRIHRFLRFWFAVYFILLVHFPVLTAAALPPCCRLLLTVLFTVC